MLFPIKIVLGSVITAAMIGLIVVGAFVMNPALFLESEDILISNSLYLSAPRDTLSINDISIVGNKLVINASYGGGCKDHVFRLVASDEWLESYPVQTSILLSHDANNDLCEAFFTERFIFNLSPLKERYYELYKEMSATIRLRIVAGSDMIPFEYKF